MAAEETIPKYTERLKVKLHSAALNLAGKELARTSMQLREEIAHKQEVIAVINGNIKSHEAKIGELSNRINTGYEERDVECAVHMDTPQPGVKTIIRLDTGDTVREEPMDTKDRQASLFKAPAEDAPEQEGAAGGPTNDLADEPESKQPPPPDDDDDDDDDEVDENDRPPNLE